MGLEDRDSMRILRDALDSGGEQLVADFYTRWFATDLSARDLFPRTWRPSARSSVTR